MKPLSALGSPLFVLCSLLFALCSFSGCSTPGATNATRKGPFLQIEGGERVELPANTVQPRPAAQLAHAFGPLALRFAQAEIAERFLKKNPKYVGALAAFETALELIANQSDGTPITDALIEGWVAKHYERWGFLAEDVPLLVEGLRGARDVALSSIGVPDLRVGDARLRPWIAAVRGGIRAGIARHNAKAAPLAPAA